MPDSRVTVSTSLRPYPFGALVQRMFRELAEKRSIFDLPARKFLLDTQGRDLSVSVHGQLASTPLGPAAGPHTQLAQNIVLSWLVGGRTIELKTVQESDELEIPRPCIDMATVGYNIEWSQELKLEQSLEEYVKAAMLIRILEASGELPISGELSRTAYELSVGYDFKGITSTRVRAFFAKMRDTRALVDALRRQIPDEHKRYRDLDFPSQLSSSVTLSTFHGCPPDEIERIAEHLLTEEQLSCTLKLNPTLLGRDELFALLHDKLGYHEIRVPESAFDKDAKWEQIHSILERLSSLDKSLGVKFTNTLVVENHRSFFPEGTREMYLSGPPLHVLAMALVRRFRQSFGHRFPISFSAGIDFANFADAVALDLCPITVCTDWLKAGGYGRAHRYFDELFRRMDRASAKTRGDYILRAYGKGREALRALHLDEETQRACEEALDEGRPLREAARHAYDAWVKETSLRNTEHYVDKLADDPRYDRAHNEKPPRKIGQRLELFDCITCDKCVPVCPNDANFTFVVPRMEIPIVKVRREAGGFSTRREGLIRVDEKHQIGNFADLCNECGNCDVFCPEEGGPYILKARVFGSREALERAHGDGFYFVRRGARLVADARLSSKRYHAELEGDEAHFSGQGFDLCFSAHDPEGTLEGEAESEVDLTVFRIMNVLGEAILSPSEINYLSFLQEHEA